MLDVLCCIFCVLKHDHCILSRMGGTFLKFHYLKMFMRINSTRTYHSPRGVVYCKQWQMNSSWLDFIQSSLAGFSSLPVEGSAMYNSVNQLTSETTKQLTSKIANYIMKQPIELNMGIYLCNHKQNLELECAQGLPQDKRPRVHVLQTVRRILQIENEMRMLWQVPVK